MNYKTALAEQIDDMAQELADSLLTNAELSVEIKQLKEEV